MVQKTGNNLFYTAIKLSLIFSLIVLKSIYSPVHSQQTLLFNRYLSENNKIERGLSQNTIYSILQDDEGFMWFGTWDGLNRFDGYTFITYNKEQGLSNEAIRTLFQYDNKLWVGTEMGLNAINLDSGEISCYYAIEGDSASLSDNWINHIISDHLGKLWISTARGLTELDPHTMKFRQVFSRDYGNPIRSNNFNMLKQDQNNNYWIATSNGLVFFETETNKVTRYFNIPGDSSSLPDNQVNSILFDRKGQLWVATKKGTSRFESLSNTFYTPPVFRSKDIQLATKDALTLMDEPDGTLWIGTNGNGLYKYIEEKNAIEKHLNIPNQLFSLSDSRIFNLYRDRNGMIWIGTFNGLNKLNHNAPKFRTFRSDPDYPNSLSNNSVWCFEEDLVGNIWIGTESGISILDQTTGNFSFIKNQPDNPNSLSGNQIRTIWRDSLNRFWIGTRYTGLTMFDATKKIFTRYRYDAYVKNGLPDDFILSVVGDNEGIMWVGTENGLGKLTLQDGTFKNYFHDPKAKNSIPDNKVYDVFIDSKKRFWVCTSNGLAKYNKESDDFTSYKITESVDKDKYIVSNKFFSISEDNNGLFWLGTRSGGLVSFDATSNKFMIYTDRDGLPNNVTYLIIEDKSSDLWITTNWGLARYSPSRNVFTNYEVTDGLQSNEFNFNAGMLTKKGELFFGGMNGFSAFFPEDISINKTPPEIQISAFKLFNVFQNRRIKSGDTLRLKYEDNFFSFEFAAVDFTNPARIKYRYQLENYNVGWIERNSGQRFAEYAKVSPGTYVFRVIAANSDGYWNKEGVKLTIIIQPPWYQTWIFRILVLLLLVVSIYLIIFMRMRSIRKSHVVEKKYLEFEKKMFQLEQKALQLQMNPHFLFNSLNSIQSFIVNSDIDNAIHYLSKFSQLMRRMLSNSRESYVPVRDELQALQLYLDIEKLRFSDNFDYKIIVDDDIDDSFIEIPPMILQPYVENAIIHGLMHKTSKGHLLIHLQAKGETILVIIQDDGIGRERAAEIRRESGIERKSRGMLITKERLEILNQYTKDTYTVSVIDLTDKAGNSAGTRVEIIIHANTA